MEFPPVLRTVAILAALILGVVVPPAAADSVIMAAGDISCQGFGGCHQQGTSDILVAQRNSFEGLAGVLTLGDNQYDSGKLAEFQKYFDPTWGRVKDLIHPVPGNHDYQSGYYDYFGTAAGPRGKGFYSYDIGSWHLIALNSCYGVSCSSGSEQERWLKADLAAHPAACTLAYWHDAPAVTGAMQAFADDLQEAGADIILGGHDHNWKKWSYKDIRVFTVGTGGESGPSTWGVIKIVLRTFSYDWRFVPENGKSSSEEGSGVCHGSQLGVVQPPGGGGGGDGGFQVVSTTTGDARMKSESPDRSYGDDDKLEVEQGKPKDPVRRSYLRFEVSGIAGPVTGATLRLEAMDDADDGGNVFVVDSGWSESTLTWATAPVPGPDPIGWAGRVSRGTVDIPLDPVAFMRDGTYALALSGGDSHGAEYASREGSSAAQLILTGIPPVPTPPPPEPPVAARVTDVPLARQAVKKPSAPAKRRTCTPTGKAAKEKRKRAARPAAKRGRGAWAVPRATAAVKRAPLGKRAKVRKRVTRRCTVPKRRRPASTRIHATRAGARAVADSRRSGHGGVEARP